MWMIRDEVEYIAASAVRALDNVIDLNFYPLALAGITNQNYRRNRSGSQQLPSYAGKARYTVGERGTSGLCRPGV